MCCGEVMDEKLSYLSVVRLTRSIVRLDLGGENGEVGRELGDAFYGVLSDSVQSMSDVEVLKVGVDGGAQYAASNLLLAVCRGKDEHRVVVAKGVVTDHLDGYEGCDEGMQSAFHVGNRVAWEEFGCQRAVPLLSHEMLDDRGGHKGRLADDRTWVLLLQLIVVIPRIAVLPGRYRASGERVGGPVEGGKA